MAATITADTVKLRAWWAHRQGLDGGLAGAGPAAVLAGTGWARSVGGSNPYLTLFARAGTDRAGVDRAVASLAIHELPSARGCTYVLPAEHYALGLTLSERAAEGLAAEAGRFGVPRAELDRLGAAVVKALDRAGGPMDPAGLKAVLGDRVRHFGEEGRRRGMSTALPTVLGLLQSAGEIRRVPVNGRLDQQRYSYVRWHGSPRRVAPLAPADARAELARLFFSWTGPASLAHFRWFSGFGARDARAAIAPLDLRPVEGTDLLIRPEDIDEFTAYTPPAEPRYQLLTWIDGLVLLRRDLAALLDPAEADQPLLGRRLGGVADLATQMITDRGRIVGLWEYDPGAERIVWTSFVPVDAALRAAVAGTEEYAREQLGDVRGGSLDSPASRRPRLDEIRAMAGGRK